MVSGAIRVTVTGTPHFQGFLRLRTKKRMSTLQNITSPRWSPHWDKVKSVASDCIHYCTKPHDSCMCDHCRDCPASLRGPWSFGDVPVDEATRTDLMELAKLATKGTPHHKVAAQYPVAYMKYHKHYTALTAALASAPVVREPKVYLLIGPTGTGKSAYVYDKFADNLDDLYKPPIQQGRSIWFDYLVFQKALLFEEYTGRLGLTDILRIIDRYPELLPVKGAFSSTSRLEEVYFCTNIHPRKWYDYHDRHENYLALVRRFTAVLDFSVRSDPSPDSPNGRFRRYERFTQPFLEFFSGELRDGDSGESVRLNLVNGKLAFVSTIF